MHVEIHVSRLRAMRVECIMSVVTLHGQIIRHQSPVRSRARSEYFYARVVHVQLHTLAFLKFKSSCTVARCFDVF